MVNGQKEIWVKTGNSKGYIAISNCGRLMDKNGIISFSTLRQKIHFNGKRLFVHRIIVNLFLDKTEEDVLKQRNYVDHITHYPKNYNVNDVRNLRWCNHRENMGFEESRNNHSKSLLNKTKSSFGKKYYDYFGYSDKENHRQYAKEWKYWKTNGKCRWEE